MKHSLAILCCVALTQLLAQSPCREVVGYYPNWQWYDRAQLVKPTTIDYSKYSVINYAFFSPQTNGTLLSTDAWADENLLLGPMNWSLGVHDETQSLPYLCEQHGVKLLASIGGWTLSYNFPSIAADPVKRNTFADACVDLIETYGFDGIDIDWEYPGYAPNGGTPADEGNYTLLLQAVRNALDSHSTLTGETYLLTTAMPAGISNMNNIDWTAVSAILDFMNVMTYDFFGPWDSTCNHNSPLYASAQGDPTFNCAAAIETLINTFNVPASKLNMGIPFYGRSFKTNGTPALFAPVLNGSADTNTFWADEGTPLYYNVLLNQNLFTSHWDDLAQVPYLTGNGALNTFVSYDDTTSVGLKAQYIVDNNLRGVIIWEITGDYIETSPGSGVIGSTPLADMVESVFCNGYVPEVQGCTNPAADNYNPSATLDNGTCIVAGCMYPQAENYNPDATYDDLSCVFSGSSCASDLNDDGIVNITDLLIFISDFGSACP